MRWIRVGAPGQPDTSILLAPPVVDPGITDDERRTVTEMMAKGTYGWTSSPQRTWMGRSKWFRAAAPRWSRSRWPRTTGFATAPSGIPRVTSSASRSGAERSARCLAGRPRDQPHPPSGRNKLTVFASASSAGKVIKPIRNREARPRGRS